MAVPAMSFVIWNVNRMSWATHYIEKLKIGSIKKSIGLDTSIFEEITLGATSPVLPAVDHRYILPDSGQYLQCEFGSNVGWYNEVS